MTRRRRADALKAREEELAARRLRDDTIQAAVALLELVPESDQLGGLLVEVVAKCDALADQRLGPVRDGASDPRSAVVNRRLRAQHAETVEEALSPLSGHALGRKLLRKYIDLDQYNAGRRFEEIRKEARHARGAPRPDPTHAWIGDALEGWPSEDDPDRDRKVLAFEGRMNEALVAAGPNATRATVMTCCEDADNVSTNSLTEGLDALADFFWPKAHR